ncbi:MAG: autotransporter outer membrane beta-barrel domain-containing protein [Deltaproteobacteria bacterium]|nr:autotransporter outer membrane beta-barrel domain-containing protein [Deltaproteobacteria bacterium]
MLPPSSGADDPKNHIWVGTFGTWARQKARGVYNGYKYDSWGVSIGYDRQIASIEGLLLGINGTFAKGKLKTDHELTSVDLDSMSGTVYGSYTFHNMFFVDLSVSFARSKSDYSIQLIHGGHKTGSFDTDTTQIGFRTGFIFNAGSIKITPSVGVRHTRYTQKSFTETVYDSFHPANVFDAASDSFVEIPIEITFAGTYDTGSVKITPELSVGFTSMVKRPKNSFSVGFAGSSYRAEIVGPQPDRNSFQAGLGLKIETPSNVEVFLEYDAGFAKSFTEHRLSAGIGYYF